MKRIALYGRISTRYHGQKVETQLMPLREYAERRGLQVVAEYVDNGVSGTKDTRPELDKLMKAARARRFDGVLVYKFDRFGRSISHLIRALEEFQSLGVEFISLTEAVDTSTPTGKLMFAMLTAFGEFERSLIVERINSGLDRAVKQGKKLGRPSRIVDRDRVLAMRSEGLSIRKIARELKVSVGKIHAISASA